MGAARCSRSRAEQERCLATARTYPRNARARAQHIELNAWDLREVDVRQPEYYLKRSGFGYALQPCCWPEFSPVNNQLGARPASSFT